MKVATQMKKKNKGFTLIELLVVLVLISLLAGLVGPSLFNKVGSSKTKVAEAQIELLTSAINTYRLDNGDFPTTQQGLQALMTEPQDALSWDGPYLSKEVPLDPWNKPYMYELKDNGQFALYTLGKDGKKGGEDENQDVGKF
ncbi:type II secretion system major pseudopilin GspG [Oceanimonas baumannii]|uniref:Type II secretion system core protein G n=1 Tax=Oceanimonas baumannii TaxID=129578 RepID=A0A235CN33_9GAMM|nr:type II secretion system major pseudopilin GspG [Oceanimonas baumannii]OYD25988.1 type II secretion system protein GspG [Oceanimonas baumannii]TDW56977.1 general secretion pathway protein G [Oceanimonas baumannii]